MKEVEPRTEKRKRKREKQLSPVNSSEVKENNSISYVSETDKQKKKHGPSNNNLEACEASGVDILSQTTEPVLTKRKDKEEKEACETSKEQNAHLDKTLSLEGVYALQTMENHTEFKTKKKKTKRKKKRCNGCENNFPTQRLLEEASTCNLPENIQSNSSLEVLKVDLLRNNDKEAPLSNGLPSVVESEDSGLKKSDMAPENHSDSQVVKNASSICAKKASRKEKSVSFNCSKNNFKVVKEGVCSASLQVGQSNNSANGSSVLEITETDSERQNSAKTNISNNDTTLFEKENSGLRDDMPSLINSKSQEVKFTYSKRHRKVKEKENMDDVPLLINSKSSEVKTYSKRHRKVKEKEYVNSNDHSQSNMEKVPVCVPSPSSCAAQEGTCSSLMKFVELDSVEKNYEKGDISPTNSVEIDSTKKIAISPESNPNCHGVKNINSEQSKKAKKKKGKNKVFDYTVNIVELIQEDVPSTSLLKVQNVTSESSSLKEVAEVESLSNKMMSVVNKEENVDMEDNGLKKGAKADPAKENEMPLEIGSKPHEGKNTSSIQTKFSKEKGRCNSSDRNIKPLQEDVPSTSPQVVLSDMANRSVNTPASDKNRRRIKKKKKHATFEEKISIDAPVQMNCGLLDELKKSTDSCVIAGEGNLEGSSTYREEVNLPHSPIQGTIDDAPLANKQDDSFDSFKGERASFSYQVVDNAVMDESTVNHSENACESKSGDERKNMKPSHSMDNTFNPIPKRQEKKTDNFNELQRHDVFTEENVSIDRGEEKKISSASVSVIADGVALDVVGKRVKSDIVPVSPERAIISCTIKKLLVLDLNGLLVDVVYDYRNAHKAPIKVGGKSVFKRPFCDEFLQFCFDIFDIGIWSSRRRNNVNGVVDFLMGNMKHNLLFCWDQSKCTITKFNTIENVHKPLVLKELKKLWNNEEPDLPWEKGKYSPSNTLLVDDSPYKALCNPPNTAIFPYPYNFKDEDDKSLGPGGDLRVYLEGLALANDVQHYVQEHPFGQHAITSSNPSWKFYLRVIDWAKSSSVPAC